jgi:tripartite-type tricarboxylate transporter receptor subunit TctC
LRALAVTGLKRAQAALEIPTMNEFALRGYEITSWFGVVAPTGTPQSAITRLQGEFSKVMQGADVREKLGVLGSEAVGGGSADFAAHLRTEQEKWGRLIKQAGIRLE